MELKIRQVVLMFFLIFGYTSSNPVNAQDHKRQVADAFVKAVFVNKESAKLILSKYMYFEPNKDYTMDQRLLMLEDHLKKTIAEKSTLMDPRNYLLIPYNAYKGEKVNFPGETDDIFILEGRDKKPIIYLFLKNNKVFSFDYIMKGKVGYFITY